MRVASFHRFSNPNSRTDPFFPLALAAASFIVATLASVPHSLDYFPDYDAAYNATVSKNLSIGAGYSTYYDGVQKPFNPEITTGPTLIISLAIVFAALGPSPAFIPWVIGALNNSLFALIVYLLSSGIIQQRVSRPKLRSILGSVFFFGFHLSQFASPNLLGEFTGTLLLVLGVLVVWQEKSWPRFYVAGFVFGLALLAKAIFLVALVGIATSWAFWLGRKNWRISRKTSALLSVAGGIVTPILIFEAIKLTSLGVNEYLSLKRAELRFIKKKESGLNQLLAGEVENSPLERFDSVVTASPVFAVALAAGLGMITVIVVRALRNVRQVDGMLIGGILFGASAHLAWWFFIAETDWFRHLEPALFLLYSAFSLIPVTTSLSGNPSISMAWKAAIGSILVASLSSSVNLFERANHNFGSETKDAATNFASLLDSLEPSEAKFFGCGWWANRRLELVLPSSGNFYDCDSSPIVKGDILVIDRDYWENYRADLVGVEARLGCSSLLFQNPPFQAFVCGESSPR